MGAWVLQQLRREPLLTRKKEEDIDQFFQFKRPKSTHSYFA
jgi:hypothetical protein